MQIRFILIQPLSMSTSSLQATHLRFFTISVNPLQTLNTSWDPHPCVQDSPRDNPSFDYNSLNLSLLITTDFLILRERFLSFRVDDTN